MARPSVASKSQRSEELLKTIESHRTVALVDAYRLKTALLNELRDLYRGDILFRYVKNSTLLFSARMAKDGSLANFVEEHGRGTTLLVLSDRDPYSVQQSFNKSYLELPAKSGDVVDSDITVRAGNTGLPPGPVISDLNAVGIPTRIESGSVWVTKNTVVAKRGDRISPQLASALSKLDIRPMRVYLKMKAALVDGVLVSGDLLQTPLEHVQKWLYEAARDSNNVAFATRFPTPELASSFVAKASSEAISLALAIDFPTPVTMASIVARSQWKAALLESKVKQPG